MVGWKEHAFSKVKTAAQLLPLEAKLTHKPVCPLFEENPKIHI